MLFRRQPQAPAVGAVPSGEAGQRDGTPDAVDDKPLAERLRELAERIEPFANQAAHPGEIEENKDFLAAKSVLAAPTTAFETVMNYALGASFALSYPALAALIDRPDREQARERVVQHFASFPPWGMHFALAFLASLDSRPPVGGPVLAAESWWAGNGWITSVFAADFERRQKFGDLPVYGTEVKSLSGERCDAICEFLKAVKHPFSEALTREAEALRAAHVDHSFLASFGRLWKADKAIELAVAPEHWELALGQAPELLLRRPARSLIAVGEAQTGKTTFLQLVAEKIGRQGWRVFEAGGAELMAGQQWFGQLEERIRRVVQEATVEKKIVWYIPDLLQVARSGTHQGQSASILEQILPAMAAGQVAIWTETSAAGLARLLQLQPSLRNLLEMIRIEAMGPEATKEIAETMGGRLAGALGVKLDPHAIDVAIETAQQYLSHGQLPGSALSILKLALRRAPKDSGAIVGDTEVIETVSQLTGLPASILDARERLELADIRRFFSQRVLGQDEAVEAVVERIAMLKAGLQDPTKPIGVFLFAGPTGTGKTELAKTTAAFLFGSDDRLIRLDMSEFQTADSLAKILGDGTPGETGSLIARVRKQPFAVVLLDEFEKAHPGVWDLFLQVFDDGRLSDTLGQVADFRHCLIILTSNLGATSHRTSGMGFAPPDDTFSSEQVLRAIAQTYRPEFQNRLDRVIVFRLLDRELMRGILRKELDAVLTRRGLKDRHWAVEWEPSAIEFLLEKGFSPEMGARPLKRAIDRFLLAPLAASIVERKFPTGEQFVFVRSDSRQLIIDYVDATAGEGDQAEAAVVPESDGQRLADIMLAPRGSDEELQSLQHELAAVEARFTAPEFEAMRTAIMETMSRPGFWDQASRHATLARYALIDRTSVAISGAKHLAERVAQLRQSGAAKPRDVIARLAQQIYLSGQAIEDAHGDSPVEAVLAIEPALDAAMPERTLSRDWCGEVLEMYRAWAAKRNMQTETLTLPGWEFPVLAIAGFGAYRTLVREIGLHVRDGEAGAPRPAVRVSVAAGPLGDLTPAQRRNTILKALEKGGKTNTVVRRYRRTPTVRVRNGSGSWRSKRLADVLGGDFDIIAEY